MEKRKVPTEDEMKEAIRKAFPFKREDGGPSFRKFQGKTILNLLKGVFLSDKKFHKLEAPVGSGKSIINYSALMAAIVDLSKKYPLEIGEDGKPKHYNKAVMLTSMKSLQDQIAAENWPEIKSLKGKSGYACSHCQGMEVCTIRANYEGEEVDMCNNSSPSISRKPFVDRYKSLRNSIDDMVKNGSDTALRAKTNFKDVYEFDDLFKRIVGYYTSIYKYNMTIQREFRPKFYQNLMSHEECKDRYGDTKIVDEIINIQSLDSISCNVRGDLNEIECGAKSAKVLSSILGIRLLNPDIFYYLTMQPSSFSENGVMVIDEAHGWPAVMNRIFDMNIPVSMLNDVYGINLTEIYRLESQIDILKHLEALVPTFGQVNCALKTIRKLGTSMGIKHREHLDTISKSRTDFGKAMRNFIECWFVDNPMGELDLFDLVDKFVFRQELDKGCNDPFFEFLKSIYNTYLSKSELDHLKDNPISLKNIKDSILKWIGRDKAMLVSRETKALFKDGKGEVYSHLSENCILGAYLQQLRLFFDDYFRICSVIELSTTYEEDENMPGQQIFKSSAFGVYKKRVDGTTSLSRTPFDKIRNYEKVKSAFMFSLCVVDPGKMARIFFYSKAKKVIFTSGTWTFMKSTCRALGINDDDSEFYRMESTFPVENRPTYVLERSNMTDFSEKNEDKTVYIYKTDPGARKFVHEVKSFVKAIKEYAQKKYGIDPNIIIHSHSFILTKTMLEFGEYDKKWLFHTGGASENIRNRDTGYVFETHLKDECISILKNNHDKGYVFVSPSITEGVSFDFGASRFQIILKFPIPNMIDPYVQTIMKGDEELGIVKDPDYVDRLIYTTLGQMYGRVMRDPKDWGFTFMLDQQIPKRLKWACASWNDARRDEINNPYFFESIKCKYGYKGSAVFMMPFLYK